MPWAGSFSRCPEVGVRLLSSKVAHDPTPYVPPNLGLFPIVRILTVILFPAMHSDVKVIDLKGDVFVRSEGKDGSIPHNETFWGYLGNWIFFYVAVGIDPAVQADRIALCVAPDLRIIITSCSYHKLKKPQFYQFQQLLYSQKF